MCYSGYVIKSKKIVKFLLTFVVLWYSSGTTQVNALIYSNNSVYHKVIMLPDDRS